MSQVCVFIGIRVDTESPITSPPPSSCLWEKRFSASAGRLSSSEDRRPVVRLRPATGERKMSSLVSKSPEQLLRVFPPPPESIQHPPCPDYFCGFLERHFASLVACVAKATTHTNERTNRGTETDTKHAQRRRPRFM